MVDKLKNKSKKDKTKIRFNAILEEIGIGLLFQQGSRSTSRMKEDT